MTTPPAAGADLARIALVAAKQAAKQRGTHGAAQRKPKRRSTGAHRAGRDPLALEGALAALIVERGWETPAAAGSILDRWTAIATPEIAAHLQAVGFDERTGTLEILATSAAWATQGRLLSIQLMRQANDAAGRQAVHHIAIKAPGSRTPPSPAPAVTPSASQRPPPGPIRTRADAPDGYHQARSAVQSGPRTRSDGPLRTREAAHPGYHQVILAIVQPGIPARPSPAPDPLRASQHSTPGYQTGLDLLRAAPPAPAPRPSALHTRAAASAGYTQVLQALRAGKGRSIPPSDHLSHPVDHEA
ncbi:DciA family protein [Streptomyces sp. H10-C2]|uniref:DciA family protein n=1 Tax=unclassified Streptomyces TaxID=2593676 RepID=UPI0024B900F4|nr:MULTISPECIES: DciA family protein [unclassified Streptomyces]MDJ0342826.1 DciA family protein [Streptomyces sp. PH10-H1]MDJ0372504.1 DciA family protein [Streptomyces sp. H10-C2]